MKKVLALLLIAVSILGAFYYKSSSNSLFQPEPEDDEENEHRKEQWLELIHKAAPGTDWKQVEAANEDWSQNWRNNYLAAKPLNTLVESFANGALQGNWEEKGSNNQAGRNTDGAYDSVANNFYAISNNGTLWRTTTGSNNWIELNNTLRFSHNIFKILKNANGTNRIIASRNGNVVYSDNEGSSFTNATGIVNPTQIVALNDATQAVYCLNNDGLYRSTNLGQSFTKIFNISSSNFMATINKTHNANQVYLLDNATTSGSLKLYSVSGATVTLLNTAAITQPGRTLLRSVTIGSTTTLYALLASTKMYKSTNNGATWTLQNSVTSSNAFEISMDDPQKLFIGGVEAYRSYDGGLNWTLINAWSAYYGDPLNKLHADITTFTTFRKPDNSSILFINCDGGTYISNDNLTTATNVSMTTLRNSEYYDVLTDPDQPNRLFAGSQDQGFQRNTTATTAGPLNFVQVISGDYGYLALTGNPKHLWTQYPGGRIYYYDNPLGNAVSTYTIPGTQLPNYSWMLPVANTYTGKNEVLMAGGNITGGSGSYLAKLTAATTTPYAITATQFSYDFRANSNSTNAGITAIETVKNDTNRIYVATEDGSFFYTTNGGANWSKTTSFSGPTPWYLYGSSIYSSRLTANLLWYAGTGYSNPGVYKSINGGQTFTAMNNGLPSTLVYQIVANPNETMLFAATEAGPYVYVVADNQWYPMLGTTNPLHTYNIVEYIEATNTVRFGTYGRGIWDFVITNAAPTTPTVTFTGNTNFCEGNNLVLQSSAAIGNQWYKDGVAITGATGTTYAATQSGSYNVKATVSGQTSGASNTVVITVTPAPAIPTITASGPLTICQGNTVTLSSSASLNIQWYKDNDPITGATSSSYIATQSGGYTVKVTSAAGCSSISSPTTITVNALPSTPLITAGGPITFCEGNSVQLTSSTATGNQWYVNNAPIASGTSQSLTVNQSGNYSLTVTNNGCQSNASPSVGVTVNPIPPKPTVTLSNGKLTSSAVSGNQWYLNNVLIPYATANSYTPTIAGQYSVQAILNGCKSPMSNLVNFGTSSGGLQNQVLVTPNPVRQNMVIISTTNDPIKIELFDNKGSLLMNKTFTGTTDVSMLMYPASIYVVRVTNTKTKESFRKQIAKVN